MVRQRQLQPRGLKGRFTVLDHTPRGVYQIIREHLRDEGLQMEATLGKIWNVHPHSASRIMYGKRSLSPQHLNAFAEYMKLDEFDREELHQAGARNAGWQIGKAPIIK